MTPETQEGNPLPEQSVEILPEHGCASCGNPNIVAGYSTALCAECREKFIKFPIPAWIKIFAGGIAAILIISLVSLPKNLSLGLHLEKGGKAEKFRRYLTAQREFAIVIKKAPDNYEAWGHLMLASFYNMDFETFDSAASKLEGISLDGDLIGELNGLIDRYNTYTPNDSFSLFMKSHLSETDSALPESAMELYLEKHPHDPYALLSYANNLYDKEKIDACDSILTMLLESEPLHMPALYLRTSVKRQKQEWEEAIAACERILDQNAEAAYAIASKARIMLQQSKDKEGLMLAEQAIKVNREDPFSIATLAIAYHFNNNIKERDKIIKAVNESGDSSKLSYIQYAKDIIQQKEKFR